MLIPRHLTLTNYITLFKQNEISGWILTSTLLALVSTATALTVGILAAFSLTHFRYRGIHVLGLAVFFAYVIPKGLLFIPLFLLLNKVGLVGTFPGLVLAHETFSIPFCTWLLYGYFKTLPKELMDATRIDGCGPLGVLWRVILPLAGPGIATAAIFAFYYLVERVSLRSPRRRQHPQDAAFGYCRLPDCRLVHLGTHDGCGYDRYHPHGHPVHRDAALYCAGTHLRRRQRLRGNLEMICKEFS